MKSRTANVKLGIKNKWAILQNSVYSEKTVSCEYPGFD